MLRNVQGSYELICRFGGPIAFRATAAFGVRLSGDPIGLQFAKVSSSTFKPQTDQQHTPHDDFVCIHSSISRSLNQSEMTDVVSLATKNIRADAWISTSFAVQDDNMTVMHSKIGPLPRMSDILHISEPRGSLENGRLSQLPHACPT